MFVKRLFSIVLVAIALVSTLFASPAIAADADNGGKIFSANCAACHMGGGNMVNPEKTLKKETLSKYSMDSLDAIKTQVTNGKAAMPAFGGRLTAAEIEDVATYVLSQSEAGW
jgi:cytochrome c6